jgi:hypothetical protein
MNSLKHGCRAAVVPLPNEDPKAIEARAREWHDYYRPESPAARHLADECAHATVLADRCRRALTAALAEQVRAAVGDWDARQEDEVAALAARLPGDPAAAVRKLKRTAAGCRWLIERWEALAEELARYHVWCEPERMLATRLLGLRPEPEHLPNCPEAFLVHLFNFAGNTTHTPDEVRALVSSDLMPACLRERYGPATLPAVEPSRAWLARRCVEELEGLRAREERLRVEVEGPSRAGAADRALAPRDDGDGRLLLRYQAEARTAFHQAYGQLIKTLERDRAEAEAAVADPAPAPEAPAAEPPNEPDRSAAAGPPSPPEPSDPSDPSGSPNEPRTVGDWLVHLLAAEGVAATLVTTPEAPSAAYEGGASAPLPGGPA